MLMTSFQFHLKFVFSLFTSSSVFLLLKNLCGSAISWWIGGCLIIHQVLKREIPWVPGYVRVVLLLFTPCLKYNQRSRELGSQDIVLIIYGLFPHSTRNPKLKIHCWYSQSTKDREEIRSLENVFKFTGWHRSFSWREMGPKLSGAMRDRGQISRVKRDWGWQRDAWFSGTHNRIFYFHNARFRRVFLLKFPW